MSTNNQESDYKSSSSRRPKRPDMKLYVPPRAPRNTSEAGSDHSIEHGSEESVPMRCKTASLEKLRDPASAIKTCESAEDDSWDSIFDENGDCVNSHLSNELNKTLRVSADSFSNTRPKSSLGHSSSCSSSSLYPHASNASKNAASSTSCSSGRLNGLALDAASEAALEHVLELITIGSNRLSTADIRVLLANSVNSDYDVIWVDDMKALLVFSSKSKAEEAFQISYPNIKLKRLTQASSESRSKAFVLAPQPFKKRPETSAVLARRLVSGALGLRVNISAEQRAAESKKLQEARVRLMICTLLTNISTDRKRNMIRKSKDIWEGNVN